MKKNEKNKITTCELTPERWNDFETLFGTNGACGGCWCYSWRLQKGENFKTLKGIGTKKIMKAKILAGEITGVLAYDDDKPIGWLSIGRRNEFHRINSARTINCEDRDREDLWSMPCFFIHKDYRGQGISSLLVKAGIKIIKQKGGKTIEGYPINTKLNLPAAFVWTGLMSIFEKEGFKLVGDSKSSKLRVRKEL